MNRPPVYKKQSDIFCKGRFSQNVGRLRDFTTYSKLSPHCTSVRTSNSTRMALVSGHFHTFSVFSSILTCSLRHTFHYLLECGKRLYTILQETLERSTYCFHIINSISLNKTPDSRGSHGLWTVSW